jgi:hypothetical protein
VPASPTPLQQETFWEESWRDLDVTAPALLARRFPTVQLAGATLGQPLAAHGLQPGWFDLWWAQLGCAAVG